MFVLSIIVVLIAVNALFVAAEFATVSVRQSKILQRADRGDRLALLLMPVLRDAHALDRYIAACQIGITVSSLVLGAFGQAMITPRLMPVLAGMGLEPVAALSTAATVVLIGLTVVQMILGELVPKSLALQFPTQVSLWTVLPMRWSQFAMSWFIVVLNGSGTLILRLLRMHDASGHRHIHSPQEIELLIADSRDGGQLDPGEHKRLSQALKLGVRSARAIMVPRHQIVAMDATTAADEAISAIAAVPYARMPVYEKSIDRIIGYVHVRDLAARALSADRTWTAGEVMRKVLFVPQSMTADQVLARMREDRKQLAIVVDEFGGTAGLVTVVDILDEVMGDVADERQPVFEPETLADGSIRLPGDTEVTDAARLLGFDWQGTAHTVAGLMMEQLGRVPTAGDSVTIGSVELRVERIRRHSVATVLGRPSSAPGGLAADPKVSRPRGGGR